MYWGQFIGRIGHDELIFMRDKEKALLKVKLINLLDSRNLATFYLLHKVSKSVRTMIVKEGE
jgi:hypothetical protein